MAQIAVFVHENRAKGVLARRMRGDDELAARKAHEIVSYLFEVRL